MQKVLRIGIIGESEGNGHPYSWSAIINGYQEKYLEKCPYKTIREYLRRQKNTRNIANAKVTHIWTQDRQSARAISQLASIKEIVTDYRDMIGKVDAILLARDDYENHIEISRPFINAGIPIYIDKPLAVKTIDAIEILNNQKYDGQVFSCSAVRNASELIIKKREKERLGKIRSIYGISPNSWEKYAIHIIEVILKNYIEDDDNILNKKRELIGKGTKLICNFESGIEIILHTRGEAIGNIELKIEGTKGNINLVFEKSYEAFRTTIEIFIEQARTKEIKIGKGEMLKAVSIIEAGTKQQ